MVRLACGAHVQDLLCENGDVCHSILVPSARNPFDLLTKTSAPLSSVEDFVVFAIGWGMGGGEIERAGVGEKGKTSPGASA